MCPLLPPPPTHTHTEGICGSCVTNIDGQNNLACLSKVNRDPSAHSPTTTIPQKRASALHVP
jgi:succinate dehydrogenase/fumarate reductase-like Fe-S protein